MAQSETQDMQRSVGRACFAMSGDADKPNYAAKLANSQALLHLCAHAAPPSAAWQVIGQYKH